MALGTKQNKVSKVLITYEINHIWTAEMKWKWRNDRRSERNLCNCVKKPEKIQDSTGFEPVTSRYRWDALPTELWSHWRWEQVNWPALNVSIFKVSKVSQWTSGWGIQSMTWRLLWPVTMPPGQIPGDLRFFFSFLVVYSPPPGT